MPFISSIFTPLFYMFIWASVSFAVNAASGPENIALEQANALTPDLTAGKEIYALCAACHGEEGLGQQAGEFPSIAGQHKSVILKQLFDIQSKKRLNPTMFPFVDRKTLGGLQGMANVSAYAATLKPNAEHIKGRGTQIKAGQALYQTDCLSCHGAKAEGDAKLFYPRINQQHYPYLVRELGWIKNKLRKNANSKMVAILQNYSEQDIQAVADYLASL